MNKLSFLTASALGVLTLTSIAGAVDTSDTTNASPYYQQAFGGGVLGVDTGVGGAQETTESGINHLPVFHGQMHTNNTFRTVNIAEQVLTIVGDGKHGLWRLQDDGRVRLYRTDESIAAGTGIDAPANFVANSSEMGDPVAMQDFVDSLGPTEVELLKSDYTHFDDSASFDGYKTNASGVNPDGKIDFIDVLISHDIFDNSGPESKGYKNHVPIDLPVWYCTMSEPSHPNAKAAMDFAFAQPGAGAAAVGPLGKRAGLDVQENYTGVVRLDTMGDAQLWVNTLKTGSDGSNTDDAFWRAVNRNKTKTEIYFVKRPFFNEDYLFVIAVVDDSNLRRGKRGQFSYIRPSGPYYDHLVARADTDRSVRKVLRTSAKKLIHNPGFHVKHHRYDHDGNVIVKRNGDYLGTPRYTHKRGRAYGFRLYGIHHPGDRQVPVQVATPAGSIGSGFSGACPAMGGDFGETYFGSAWPVNYQEVTPLCDALVIDIKLWGNLDGKSWNREFKNLANNAGSVGLRPDGVTKEYNILYNTYGNFSNADNPDVDPYMDNNGVSNPDQYTPATPTLPDTFDADGDGDTSELIWSLDTLGYPFTNDQVACNEFNEGDCPNSPHVPQQ